MPISAPGLLANGGLGSGALPVEDLRAPEKYQFPWL